jgi:hypothetical protein
MRQTVLNLPELVLLVGTRAAAGLGLGLLLADHLPAPVRRPIGWSLVLIGVLSTFPLAINVIEHTHSTNLPE